MSRTERNGKDRLDPRARRTRRLLIDAFGALLLERSYGRITVGDITARATVNRATFYLHFRDKDELLEYALRNMTQDALEQSAPVPAVPGRDYLEVLLAGVCELLMRMDRQCPRSHKQFEALMEAQVLKEVRARVDAWLAHSAGSEASRLEPLMGTIISAGLFAAAQTWRQDGRRPAARTFARTAVPVLLAPLSAA